MPIPLFIRRQSKKRPLAIGAILLDDFQSYGNGATVNGLNGGTNNILIRWISPYAAITGLTDIFVADNLDEYTNGAALNGLNGGSAGRGSWNGSYVGI